MGGFLAPRKVIKDCSQNRFTQVIQMGQFDGGFVGFTEAASLKTPWELGKGVWGAWLQVVRSWGPRKWCCEKQGCLGYAKCGGRGLKTCVFFPSELRLQPAFCFGNQKPRMCLKDLFFLWKTDSSFMWLLILCGKASLSWIPWDLHHIWSHFVSGGFVRLKISFFP